MAKAAAIACLKVVPVPTGEMEMEIPSEQTLPLAQQLEALWHFECVVSPRSPPAGRRPPPSPVEGFAELSDGAEGPRSPASGGGKQAAGSSLASRRVLQRVFRTFDENGDGRVSSSEIARILHRLDIPTSASSTHALLRGLRTKVQGHVDEEEFLQLFESICCFVEEEKLDHTPDCEGSPADDGERDLMAAFHVFDKDGNGFISPSELQSVLCSLGFDQARHLEACVSMIARVDENGDGQVDFFEFKKLFHMEDPLTPPSIESF